MKYLGGSEPVEGDWETIFDTETRTTSPLTINDFDPSLHKKIKFHGRYAVAYGSTPNKEFTSSEIEVSSIPAYGETPLIIGGGYICVTLGQDGDSLYIYSDNSYYYTIIDIQATPLTLYPPQILEVFGKVGDEWVDFPAGGEGGSGYSETVLWNDDNGLSFNGNNQQTIQLSDDMNNYDILAIEYSSSPQATFGHALCFVLVSTIDKTGALAFWGNPDSGESRSAPYSYYVDNTHIKLNMTTAQVTDAAFKVIGVKFGRGGGNSDYHTYSTTEQVVGKWIDGSDIYEKILDFGSNTHFNTGWQNAEEHQGAYSLVFGGTLINTDGVATQVDMACNDTTYLEVYITHTTDARYLIFRYIKSTS